MIVVDMPTRSKEDSTHDPIADEADFVTSMVKHGFTAHFAGSRQFTPPLGSNFLGWDFEARVRVFFLYPRLKDAAKENLFMLHSEFCRAPCVSAAALASNSEMSYVSGTAKGSEAWKLDLDPAKRAAQRGKAACSILQESPRRATEGRGADYCHHMASPDGYF